MRPPAFLVFLWGPWFILIGSCFPARADDALRPDQLLVERPTLHCLGVRWYVQGDANRNATGQMRYRRQGESEWNPAYPLLRVMQERVGSGEISWNAPNMLAGSVVGLEPDTLYELQLVLADPDGIKGSGRELNRVVSARTRAEPRPFTDGRTLHVHAEPPPLGAEQPAFDSLLSAYAAAAPGDQILLHAGIHTTSETLSLHKPCSAEKPLVIRGAGDGPAVLDGAGRDVLLDLTRAQFHQLEGLTIQNATTLLRVGRDDRGAEGLVIRRCTLRRTQYAVLALSSHCRDLYVADCEFFGDWDSWSPRYDASFSGDQKSHAVWLMGQGHVVCHSRFRGWWDGVDYFGGSPPEDPRLQNCAGDIYGNEFIEHHGDGIELDYAVANVRTWGNRMERVIGGISCQPVYGGPAYIFRNVVYDFVLYPVKFNQHPAGILIFHNTFVGRGSAGRWAAMWQNTRILNNLFIGGDGGPGVLWTGTPTPTTSVLDYNGWRMHPVSEPAPIWWRFASPRRSRGGSMSHEDTFETLDAFAAATGYESHGVVVDHGVFRRFAPPAGSSGPPELDLRLREGSIAADRGTVLPNFNDGFAAGAPDLGAFEATAPPPQYGPRP